MSRYESSPPYEHGIAETLGVLLVNLGTPDAPTPSAVRRYLAEFLWDPRVVETPRLLWWLILHGVILRIRPSRSAHAYAKIWTDEGSPLLIHTNAIAAGIGGHLDTRLAGSVYVATGMSYGSPSIESALETLHERNVRRLVVLPLYPQYSGTTTASVFDAVTRLLSRRRWLPELRFVNQYHDSPGYITAVANSIREYWQSGGQGDHLLFSFHGLPEQNLLDGDPYHCQCLKSARLIAQALELGAERWSVAFQSRVGRAQWLRPYTDETIVAFGRDGLGRLDVVCPGFPADCLETLEEIAIQNAEAFTEAGGGELRYIPALNARDDHVTFLAGLVEDYASGWPETSPDWSGPENEHARERSRKRALEAGAER